MAGMIIRTTASIAIIAPLPGPGMNKRRPGGDIWRV
jgi:hypothetical protein